MKAVQNVQHLKVQRIRADFWAVCTVAAMSESAYVRKQHVQ